MFHDDPCPDDIGEKAKRLGDNQGENQAGHQVNQGSGKNAVGKKKEN